MHARDLFNDLIESVRSAYRANPDEVPRWAEIGKKLEGFVSRPEIQEISEVWSVPEKGGPYNLNFYEDPEYGFVIHGLLKKPNVGTPIHDHGSTWTAYGLLKGEEKITVVQPSETDAAKYETLFDKIVGAGHVDVVRPHQLHAERAGLLPTVALIVRSGRVDNKLQTHVDPHTGTKKQGYGPQQLAADIVDGRLDL